MPNHEAGALDLLPRAVEKAALHAGIAALCASSRGMAIDALPASFVRGMADQSQAVARFVQHNGLGMRHLRKFVRTADSDHDNSIFLM
jgi:hypothetical protein